MRGDARACLVDFVLAVRPPRLHLLGIGAENRNARKILRLIEHYSPETEITPPNNAIVCCNVSLFIMASTFCSMTGVIGYGLYATAD